MREENNFQVLIDNLNDRVALLENQIRENLKHMENICKGCLELTNILKEHIEQTELNVGQTNTPK